MSKKKTINLKLIGFFVVVGVLGGTLLLGLPAMPYNAGTWFGMFGTTEQESIVDTEEYNDQKAWLDVKIKVGIKNGYTYNHPNLVGLAVEVRDGSNVYVDGGSTGSDGTWTSTVETFDSGDTYTLIMGGIATTNKSQVETFIVQGENGDSKPTDIYCGTFMYYPVAEESGVAFAFYDENYAALTEANFTSTFTDNIVDGFIKVTFSASSTGLGRQLWSSTKGYAKTYIAFIITESTLVTASAVRFADTPNYKGMGTPTGKAVFVVEINPMSYEVDEDSNVIAGCEAVHWIRFKADFTGCGVTGSNATEFTMNGVVSYEYDWSLFAAGGSAYMSTWFSDTDLSAINLVV